MAIIYCNADSGDDSTGDGSSSTPYLTINKCYTVSSSGDTIMCQASTATYAMPGSGDVYYQILHDLTITAETVGDATIDGGDVKGSIMIEGEASLVVSNLIFKRFILAYQNPIIGTPRGGWGITTPQTLVVQNCKFIDIKAVADFSGFGGLLGCNSSRNLSSQGNIQGEITIKDCMFSSIKGSSSPGAIVYFNRETTNLTVNVFSCSMLVNGTTAASTICGFVECGNHYTITGSVVNVKNNIFRASKENVTWITLNNSAGVTYTNNCFDTSILTPPTNTGGNTDNIYVEASYVDEENDNLRLRPISTLFDAGVTP